MAKKCQHEWMENGLINTISGKKVYTEKVCSLCERWILVDFLNNIYVVKKGK